MTKFRFDPLNHFDYALVDTFCECRLCLEWRAKQGVFAERQTALGRLHKVWAEADDTWRDAMYQYTAVTNRRDLYCEMSFHAAHTYPMSGQAIMAWIAGVIDDPGKTDGWWIMREVNLPIHYWVLQFKRHLRNGLPIPVMAAAVV